MKATRRSLKSHLLGVLIFVAGVGLPEESIPGECVSWQHVSKMEEVFRHVDPDHLTHSQKYYLSCLLRGLNDLADRIPDDPSPKTLKGVRETYKRLASSSDLAAAMVSLTESKHYSTRCRGRLVSALLGRKHTLEVSILECGVEAPWPLVLAILNDDRAVDQAIESFDDPFRGANYKGQMLDALYYLST